MKNISAILCLLFVASCSRAPTDPILCITISERQGEFLLDTSIDTNGSVFRGYYHESDNLYQRRTNYILPKPINEEIWSVVKRGSVKRKAWCQDPPGNFKTIGVRWLSGTNTYGTSYDVTTLNTNASLYKVLQIIRALEIDTWSKLNNNSTEQAGPEYPPQSVGSSDP